MGSVISFSVESNIRRWRGVWSNQRCCRSKQPHYMANSLTKRKGTKVRSHRWQFDAHRILRQPFCSDTSDSIGQDCPSSSSQDASIHCKKRAGLFALWKVQPRRTSIITSLNVILVVIFLGAGRTTLCHRPVRKMCAIGGNAIVLLLREMKYPLFNRFS